jgi:RNA polymerase-binding transcription factor DksA
MSIEYGVWIAKAIFRRTNLNEVIMANDWAGDGAVQDQIDATIKDAVAHARNQLSLGPSLPHCEHRLAEIPEARRRAMTGVRLCVICQEQVDNEVKVFSG